MYYLYIKTHNKTGLKYLGKTEQEDYNSYPGSGTRWIDHLNVHGYDISTQILLKTEDSSEFKETATFFSNLFNIVESDDWANLRPEGGDGGDTSKFVDHVKRGKSISKTLNSEEWKSKNREKVSAKISETERKVKQSEEWKSTTGA